MKHDFNLPLSRTLYNQIKQFEGLRVGMTNTLPDSKMKHLTAYLRDPDYEFRLIPPRKGKAAYIRVRLSKPNIIVPMHPALAATVHKAARHLGITVNQFIKGAIESCLLKGDKLHKLMTAHKTAQDELKRCEGVPSKVLKGKAALQGDAMPLNRNGEDSKTVLFAPKSAKRR